MGMCFSGGLALATVTEPAVLAAVARGFLLVLTVLQGGGPAYMRRCVVATLILLALLSAAIGVWKLL